MSEAARPIRVVIVDDDALVRAGLAMIIGAASDLEVVGEADDGHGLQALVDRTNPDVVMMDIRMPKVDGLTATRLLAAQPDHPAILVLTTFHLDEYVFGALEAGATGFLLKDTPPQQIIEGVRVVAAGQSILSPVDTRKLIRRYASRAEDIRASRARERLAALSEREREIAALVAGGAANAEIAAELVVAEATVKAHVSHILTKLGMDNRVQVAICVHEAGLLD
ncbi:MAG: response regulator transcription factor [Propionibacteriaceae bacterium]|nr:response regulator transcription factor [Propionibacteriaceae bacterium]